MTPSGRFLLKFQQRAEDDDGFGNVMRGGDFEDVFTTYATVTPLRPGSEAVINASLTGVQPLTVSIPSHSKSRMVDNAWRAINVRTSVVYNIVSAVDSNGANATIDITMTSGTSP